MTTHRNHSRSAVPAERFSRFRALRPGPAIARVTVALGGFTFFALLWAATGTVHPDLPGPLPSLIALGRTFQGAETPDGLQLLALLASSLQRAALGFLAGVLLAIPLGVLLGTVPLLRQAFDPVVQLLRPISPITWFPVALVLMHVADAVSIFIVAVSALWPTLLSTTRAVSSVPRDVQKVARVLQFSPGRRFTRILVPYALPQVLTGMRTSFSAAWSVVIAAEVLSGASGIGGYIQRAGEARELTTVIGVMLLTGLIGLAGDRIFLLLERKVAYA